MTGLVDGAIEKNKGGRPVVDMLGMMKGRAEGGQHTWSNAIVLCPNCHRVEHEHGRPQ